MTAQDFERSLAGSHPPASLTPTLAALWWAKRGEWDTAHRLVMDDPGAAAAWVHAYLHRVEGDPGNAAYWYGRAGKPAASGDLDEEWSMIVAALLR